MVDELPRCNMRSRERASLAEPGHARRRNPERDLLKSGTVSDAS